MPNIEYELNEKIHAIIINPYLTWEDFCANCELIKKYNIINACYQKAQHYINLASNSLSVFDDCEEKNILENLTSFSISRNF